MKNWAIVGIVSILGVIALLIFGYIGLTIYVNWPDDRPLAKDLKVTEEWTEINIDPAVTSSNRAQYINLRIKDFKVDRGAKNFDIKLPDGTTIDPDIELYDEFGKKFEFHHSGFAMKFYDDVVFAPGPGGQSVTLPTGRKYTRVRIRSDIPFVCDKILWVDYDPK